MALSSAFFGEGSVEIWLENVQCTGFESELLQCSHDGIVLILRMHVLGAILHVSRSYQLNIEKM